MRITQKDIAKNLDISLITVSRALNDTGYVSKDLKEQILQYAKAHSYSPHKASQALVRNRLRKIALFSSTYPEYFWEDIRRGAAFAGEQIEGFNYQVAYYSIPDSNTDLYIGKLNEVLQSGIDGLALVNQRQYDMGRIWRIIDESGVPYVTFNVDAPESRHICYVGSSYRSGGRLAAEYIGKTLLFKDKPRVLIINLNEDTVKYLGAPNINSERLEGFLQVMREKYPGIACDISMITTHYESAGEDSQIQNLLAEREGTVDAIYMIPAFNDTFLNALECYDYRRTVTVLHDLDQSAIHHLETELLSAVIYQNPFFQGYYSVKMLEHHLEMPEDDTLQDMEIIHNLILSENRHLIRNHYAYANLMDS